MALIFLESTMPRLLVALLMTILLVVYYLYKVNVEEKDTLISTPQLNATPLSEKETKTEIKTVKKEIKKPKPKPVSQKKKDFYKMMIPALDEVYANLQQQYEQIKQLIQTDPLNGKIALLKKRYKVNSDEALLIALKPHPKSIAIAQGAMESAWGTSRFFTMAYNMFGVWSFNKNDKRIAAGETRGSKTIWVKKYDSVKESIEDYYITLSRSKAFTSFKKLNYEKENQNPYLLVKELHRYSEKGDLYGEELSAMISYNDLTQYDEVRYKKPVKKVKTVEVVETIQDSESSYGDILKDIKNDAK